MKHLLSLALILISTAVFSQTEQNDNDMNATCHIDLPDIFEPHVEEGRIMEVEVRDVHSFDVKIFDNWGKKVLESIMEVPASGTQDAKILRKIKLLENGMDDVHYNMELKSGEFQFSIDAVCNDGTFLRHVGTIQLIRTKHQ